MRYRQILWMARSGSVASDRPLATHGSLGGPTAAEYAFEQTGNNQPQLPSRLDQLPGPRHLDGTFSTTTRIHLLEMEC